VDEEEDELSSRQASTTGGRGGAGRRCLRGWGTLDGCLGAWGRTASPLRISSSPVASLAPGPALGDSSGDFAGGRRFRDRRERDGPAIRSMGDCIAGHDLTVGSQSGGYDGGGLWSGVGASGRFVAPTCREAEEYAHREGAGRQSRQRGVGVHGWSVWWEWDVGRAVPAGTERGCLGGRWGGGVATQRGS
jgi:hypothetical protein